MTSFLIQRALDRWPHETNLKCGAQVRTILNESGATSGLETEAHLISPEPLQALKRLVGAFDKLLIHAADLLH